MLLHDRDEKPFLIGGDITDKRVLLTCEHAGTRIPIALGDLGLSSNDLHDHIGWDRGALAVTRAVSNVLCVPFVAQPYSRLVIDCNRPRDAYDLAPNIADARLVPGNDALSQDAITARWNEIHQPFHTELGRLLHGRQALVSIHSFTAKPRAVSRSRSVHIGVLARDDNLLFQHLMRRLPDLYNGRVTANNPYVIEDASDYTIPVHAEARNLPHALIEVRNDLISDGNGVAKIAALLSQVLKEFTQ